MKFLCVPCDRPMKLQAVAPPDRGSLSVVYSCPDCGYEVAMLTNPYETQLVQSLGVRVGPDESVAGASGSLAPVGVGAAARSAHIAEHDAAAAAPSGSPKCPFAAMIPTMEGATRRSNDDELQSGIDSRIAPEEAVPVRWTSAAEARLANIPAFVRPMARTGIEKFAREKGCFEVDETILDEARDFFGM